MSTPRPGGGGPPGGGGYPIDKYLVLPFTQRLESENETFHFFLDRYETFQYNIFMNDGKTDCKICNHRHRFNEPHIFDYEIPKHEKTVKIKPIKESVQVVNRVHKGGRVRVYDNTTERVKAWRQRRKEAKDGQKPA